MGEWVGASLLVAELMMRRRSSASLPTCTVAPVFSPRCVGSVDVAAILTFPLVVGVSPGGLAVQSVVLLLLATLVAWRLWVLSSFPSLWAAT